MRKILILMLALAMIIPLAGAERVTTQMTLTTGSAAVEAAQVGTYAYSYKFDNWDKLNSWTANGVGYVSTYTENGNTITVTAYMSGGELKSFDWTSSSPIDVVMVKAGKNQYLVSKYDPAVTSDTGLVAPSGKGISHVTFGWNAVEVPPVNPPVAEVPEFPTVALPIAAILGLAFFMQRRKE